MEEYLVDQLASPLAEILKSSRMFGLFAAATPGMRELLTVGKLWELAQDERRTPGAEPYDLVIVDAPGDRPRPRAARGAADVRGRRRRGPGRAAGADHPRHAHRPDADRDRRGGDARGDGGQRGRLPPRASSATGSTSSSPTACARTGSRPRRRSGCARASGSAATRARSSAHARARSQARAGRAAAARRDPPLRARRGDRLRRRRGASSGREPLGGRSLPVTSRRRTRPAILHARRGPRRSFVRRPSRVA